MGKAPVPTGSPELQCLLAFRSRSSPRVTSAIHASPTHPEYCGAGTMGFLGHPIPKAPGGVSQGRPVRPRWAVGRRVRCGGIYKLAGQALVFWWASCRICPIIWTVEFNSHCVITPSPANMAGQHPLHSSRPLPSHTAHPYSKLKI